MIKTNSFIATALLLPLSLNVYAETDYQRQQSQADKAFDTFESEFDNTKSQPETTPPEESKPSRDDHSELNNNQDDDFEKPMLHTDGTTSKTTNGHQFELNGCTLYQRNISCQLMITRSHNDGVLTLHGRVGGKISLFDTHGNQYHPNKITLGNREDNYSVNSRLISGIATKATLYFENVSKETDAISILEINGVEGENGNPFKIQYRDLSLLNK